ncbi:MAG: M42 family metallopeptidase [Anaerolineae bacterium]|nr:M42 family metallopeptidase [Anaerolineae bacterium]MDW8102038.1 M42 family metallopeptidase [Anaerolineae bacterium]
MVELIKTLTETYGPAGNEARIRQLLRDMVKDKADEVKVDALGNLIALKKGKGGKKVMLAAHMDEIGIVVNYVDEKGFLRFSAMGGVFPHTLVGNRVEFENGVVGVIGVEKLESPEKVPTFDKLYIDVGAESREDCPVKVGDIGVFSRPLVAQGNRLIAKAFDDRIGCAILVKLLEELKDCPHDLYIVFTVQEELGLRGAITSAYGIAPDVGIAVDVTRTGDTPEAPKMAVTLGKGPAIKVKDARMVSHPGVRQALIRAAEEEGIPYQLEVLEGGTTDAAAIQLTREGIPAGVISIPCRYIHTPSEMVDLRDVENAVKLLLRYLSFAELA